MRWLGVLLGLVLFHLGPAPPNFAQEFPPDLLKNLQYRVSLGVCQNVATVNLSLKPLGSGHYLAEFSGAAKGAWKLLSRWLPERYQTEMVYHQGRFQPLVFREELQLKGQHVLKEYRFDYPQGRLELWRKAGNRELVLEWQTPLNGPIYDPLTLIYNLRLEALGPLAPGKTLRLPGVPSPDPAEMVLHIGPQTPQGLKIMLTIKETATGKESGPFFIHFAPEWTPTQAWTRVLEFGKLMARLLPGD